MPNIDLVSLSDLLSKAPYVEVLGDFENRVSRFGGPFDWKPVVETPWQDLVFESDDTTRLHETTIARLSEGDANYEYPSVAEVFSQLRNLEPDFPLVVEELRRSLTGLEPGFRSGPMFADAGYLQKTSVFLPADKVKAGMEVASEFRNNMPLPHPLWNALLLQLLCLRIHPFQDGNGRTFRALVSYELHRAGLISATIIPTKKILDANRAFEIRTRAVVTEATDKAARTRAVADALLFDVMVINRTLELVS